MATPPDPVVATSGQVHIKARGILGRNTWEEYAKKYGGMTCAVPVSGAICNRHPAAGTDRQTVSVGGDTAPPGDLGADCEWKVAN